MCASSLTRSISPLLGTTSDDFNSTPARHVRNQHLLSYSMKGGRKQEKKKRVHDITKKKLHSGNHGKGDIKTHLKCNQLTSADWLRFELSRFRSAPKLRQPTTFTSSMNNTIYLNINASCGSSFGR